MFYGDKSGRGEIRVKPLHSPSSIPTVSRMTVPMAVQNKQDPIVLVIDFHHARYVLPLVKRYKFKFAGLWEIHGSRYPLTQNLGARKSNIVSPTTMRARPLTTTGHCCHSWPCLMVLTCMPLPSPVLTTPLLRDPGGAVYCGLL